MLFDFSQATFQAYPDRFPGLVVIEANAVLPIAKTRPVYASLVSPSYVGNREVRYGEPLEPDAEFESRLPHDITMTYRWVVDGATWGEAETVLLRCATQRNLHLQEMEAMFEFIGFTNPEDDEAVWAVDIHLSYLKSASGDRLETPDQERERMAGRNPPQGAYPIRFELPGFDPSGHREVPFGGPEGPVAAPVQEALPPTGAPRFERPDPLEGS